jgi:hypothetical protein
MDIILATALVGAVVLLLMGVLDPSKPALTIAGAILLAGGLIAASIHSHRPSAREPRRGV